MIIKANLIDNSADLQKNYLELKKVSNQIENSFKKIINDDYDETNWQADGKKVNANIKKFTNLKNQLRNKAEEGKKLTNRNDETLQIIEDYLEKVERDIEPLVEKIIDKTKYFHLEGINEDKEKENDIHQAQEDLLVQDLQNNKEILEERRKQLESIHQTSAKIKDITDSMAKQLDEQGQILDEVETHVDHAKENAEKAKQEIIKADELSRSNRKKMICLIIIIFIAIAVITAILLSLLL